MIDKNYYIEKEKKSKYIDELFLKVIKGEKDINELEKAVREYKKFLKDYLFK